MMIASRLACVLLVIAACGCGNSNPETAQATGVVSYNGQPVEGATVVFGADSGQSRGASGITNSAGEFTLTTYQTGDGAIPGKYTVAVSKIETTGGMSADEEHEAIAAGKEVATATTVDKLPPRYKIGTESTLTAEVTKEGPNHFPFELTD